MYQLAADDFSEKTLRLFEIATGHAGMGESSESRPLQIFIGAEE
jgi:hypothetical protein